MLSAFKRSKFRSGVRESIEVMSGLQPLINDRAIADTSRAPMRVKAADEEKCS
jgi:hypothetical protein